LLEGSEDVVQLLEGRFSPDKESSDVSSRGELEKVESADVSDFNTRNVSEGFNERDISSTVDDQRSSSASVSSVSEFSFSGSDFNSVNNFLNISPGSDVLEESDGFFSSFDFLSSIRNDQGEFGDVANSVTSGLDKREDS